MRILLPLLKPTPFISYRDLRFQTNLYSAWQIYVNLAWNRRRGNAAVLVQRQKKIVHWLETNLVRNMWSAAIFFPSAFAFFSHIAFGYRINVSGARD